MLEYIEEFMLLEGKPFSEIKVKFILLLWL